MSQGGSTFFPPQVTAILRGNCRGRRAKYGARTCPIEPLNERCTSWLCPSAGCHANTRSRRAQWKAEATGLVNVTVGGQQYVKVPRRLQKAARLGLIDLDKRADSAGPGGAPLEPISGVEITLIAVRILVVDDGAVRESPATFTVLQRLLGFARRGRRRALNAIASRTGPTPWSWTS